MEKNGIVFSSGHDQPLRPLTCPQSQFDVLLTMLQDITLLLSWNTWKVNSAGNWIARSG